MHFTDCTLDRCSMVRFDFTGRCRRNSHSLCSGRLTRPPPCSWRIQSTYIPSLMLPILHLTLKSHGTCHIFTRPRGTYVVPFYRSTVVYTRPARLYQWRKTWHYLLIRPNTQLLYVRVTYVSPNHWLNTLLAIAVHNYTSTRVHRALILSSLEGSLIRTLHPS